MASLSYATVEMKLLGLDELKAKLKRRNYDPHKWAFALKETKKRFVYRVHMIRSRSEGDK